MERASAPKMAGETSEFQEESVKRLTQREKIKVLLLERQGFWVPAYLLAGIALQYGTRILELRREGFEILNSTQRRTDGTVYSWFMHPAPKGQMSLLDVIAQREQANA
jgi:hypothetical protein